MCPTSPEKPCPPGATARPLAPRQSRRLHSTQGVVDGRRPLSNAAQERLRRGCLPSPRSAARNTFSRHGPRQDPTGRRVTRGARRPRTQSCVASAGPSGVPVRGPAKPGARVPRGTLRPAGCSRPTQNQGDLDDPAGTAPAGSGRTRRLRPSARPTRQAVNSAGAPGAPRLTRPPQGSGQTPTGTASAVTADAGEGHQTSASRGACAHHSAKHEARILANAQIQHQFEKKLETKQGLPRAGGHERRHHRPG